MAGRVSGFLCIVQISLFLDSPYIRIIKKLSSDDCDDVRPQVFSMQRGGYVLTVEAPGTDEGSSFG